MIIGAKQTEAFSLSRIKFNATGFRGINALDEKEADREIDTSIMQVADVRSRDVAKRGNF